jgi:2-polyprenyl-3-methyl-5-hydroxy-6-metoxy-1,4-benzoquinol methylase
LPYRWNIRRQHLGRVLDVGCGTGRNLAHLDGNGVGVDHNETAVESARSRGLRAHTTDGFPTSPDAALGSYDTVLFAHVLEHMTTDEATALVREYLPYVRPGGRVVVICPQERGQRSDPTHVTYMPPAVIDGVLTGAGVRVERVTSFPFPAVAGRWFTHNETIVVGRTAPR